MERDGPGEVRQLPSGEQSSHALTAGSPSPTRATHTHTAQPKCREFPDSTAVSTAIASTARRLLGLEFEV
jgi:hypothetical protein